MKKIYFLLFSLFLLTGCNAEYSLVYENDKVIESLNILGNSEEIIYGDKFSSLIENYYNNINFLVNYEDQPGDLSEQEILLNYNVYNKKLINNNGMYGISLNYAYNLKKDFEKSAIVYTLYNGADFSDDYIITYDTKKVFSNYSYLKNLTISFKTDKKILEINSDEEKDGIYYWYLNEDNYLNKNIFIRFDNNQSNIPLLNNLNNEEIMSLIITISSISILIILVVIVEKVRKSNK